MTEYFTSITRIDGKLRKVIVDIYGDIINKNPIKEGLKDIRQIPSRKEMAKSKDLLLEFMRYFNEKEGRPPIASDFNNNSKYPSRNTVVRAFGNWNNALKEAGLWDKRDFSRYTEEELLESLKRFERDNGRAPVAADFRNNPEFPNISTYVRVFGSWENALKLVGLDTVSMVRKGIINNSSQKARLFELQVKEYLGEESIDLSGKNRNNPYDGICPEGPYDAKSSKLYYGKYWFLHFDNVQKSKIQKYYIGLFDKNFKKLLYVLETSTWDIMEDIEKEFMLIYLKGNYRYTIENMKKYDITEKFNKK